MFGLEIAQKQPSVSDLLSSICKTVDRHTTVLFFLEDFSQGSLSQKERNNQKLTGTGRMRNGVGRIWRTLVGYITAF